jgi:hypothetical protein
MRKLIFLFILEVISSSIYLQSQNNKDIIFRLDDVNMKVHLTRDSVNLVLFVDARIGYEFRILPYFLFYPKIAKLFIADGYVDHQNLVFQRLYNWIKEIESFFIKYHKESCTTSAMMINNFNSLTTHRSYILIKDFNMDVPYRCAMSLRDIRCFERRLIRYTRKHKIDIKI